MATLAEQIANRLKAIRKAAGYKSAKSFAQQNAMRETTYIQHESGKRGINIDLLQQYSAIHGVRLSWLVTGEGEPYLSQSEEKEFIIDNELRGMNYYKNNNSEKLPTLNGKQITLIDFKLFKEILFALAPELNNEELGLSSNDLLEFGVDIYNSIIKTTADENSRKSIISLSVASLKLGISKKGEKIKQIQNLQ